jgi:hypothetical protein
MKLDNPRKLDTTECIYCRLPHRSHRPECPKRGSFWREVTMAVVIILGWLMLLGGFEALSRWI